MIRFDASIEDVLADLLGGSRHVPFFPEDFPSSHAGES